MPNGVAIYADEARTHEPLPAPTVPRTEVIDELFAAVRSGRTPLHSGEWGRATLEVCLAILKSARLESEVTLQLQA
jgi:phthalate 4,5-cis-dihydrodiol dehydrogenase